PGRTDRARYPGRHGLARMDRPWALGGPRTLRLSALPVWGACGRRRRALLRRAHPSHCDVLLPDCRDARQHPRRADYSAAPLAPISAAMLFPALRLVAADRSLELARRDLEGGRTIDAVEQYRTARRRGLSADIWFARTIAPLVPQEAMGAATRAVGAENPQNANYTVAWLHARSGDVPATETSLRATIACAPNWYKPHWMLAQI